jgi:hypothetical protein
MRFLLGFRLLKRRQLDLPRICGERFKVYAACLSN